MIEVQNLTKRYGDVEALRGISFRVEAGEVIGFLGPNGAGKTTTMRILTTFLPASSGTVKVGGFDVFEDSLEVRRRIGYLPETPPLYDDLTVASYLRFVARIKGVSSRDRKAKIDDAIQRCGLADVRDRVIGQLSKGYRQRVGLAQALVHDPEVLILDEPTVGLDPNQIIEIRKLIHDLAGGHTVILCTHILAEVAQLCSRVVIVSDGAIVADTRLDEIPEGLGLEEFFVQVTTRSQLDGASDAA